jgi:hypothetical protein
MTRTDFAHAILLCFVASSAIAAPNLSIVGGGLQAGNWVWDVSVTPDLVLAGGRTPMAVELGFRLTDSPLLSVTNVNPTEWDANNPGLTIFGWETLFSDVNNHAAGIEAKCTGCNVTNTATLGTHPATVVAGTNNEIFVAMGSGIFDTPGPKSLLQIIARGPGNGGSLVSTIQWLGAYHGGQGLAAQLIGDLNAGTFVFSGFDVQTGLLTQSLVPEPTSGLLLGLGTVALGLRRTRRERKYAHC